MEARVIKCNRCNKELPVTTDAKSLICPSCEIISSVTGNQQSGQGQGMRHLIRSFISRMNNKVPDTSSPSNSQSLNCNPSPTTPTVKSSKRALLCGVTYKKSKYKLKGPINDVRNMRDLLIDNFKFPKEFIRVLTEEEPDQKFTPTKVNIQASLKWLVEDCNSGDSLVFYFSGHGLRQPDFNEEEEDGFDETICPIDFMKEGMILDNELNSAIVQPLKKGVKLHAIVDACHSGSVLDLSYMYNKRDMKSWKDCTPQVPSNKNTSGGLAICISACMDNEMASDTSAFSNNKTMNGALTYTFIEVVKKHQQGITYGNLLDWMDERIDDANQQGQGCLANAKILRRMFQDKLIKKPLLSSSEQFDVYTKPFEL